MVYVVTYVNLVSGGWGVECVFPDGRDAEKFCANANKGPESIYYDVAPTKLM